MQTYQLPDHFLGNTKIDQPGRVYLYDYKSETNKEKTKVTFRTNAISFLVEGKKELFVVGDTQMVSNDSFLILKTGNCLMTERLSEANHYHSILLFFDDSILIDFLAKYNVLLQQPNTNSSDLPHYLMLPYNDFLYQYRASLATLFDQQGPVFNDFLKLKLEEFFLYQVQNGRRDILRFLCEAQTNDWEVHFKQIIESNIHRKLSLEEMAFLCSMSLSTFKRHFQKLYHTTPGKWFQSKRLEQAAQWLTVQGRRPSDIYLEAGFESLSSFTQSFKSKFGLTPKQYQVRG